MGLSRKVAVLAVLVVALAVWIFRFELPGEQEAQERSASESRLLDFDPARVDTLRVQRSQMPWTLVRVGDDDAAGREAGWWLIGPIVERAEDRYVENALEQLLSYHALRRLPVEGPDAVWSRYGLSAGHPARVDIVVALDDGTRQVLQVGSVDPTGEYVYVRRDDAAVLDVAWGELVDLALSAHHSFRRPLVFDVDRDRVARLSVEAPAGAWQAERDRDSGLWFTRIGGERVRLQRWQLDELVYTVVNASVSSFQRDGMADGQWAGYGLDRPWASFAFETYDGEAGRLDLGNETDDRRYFARRDGLATVFETEWGFEDVFGSPVQQWIDRNPIPRNVRRASTVRIEDPDGTWVELERTGDQGRDWIVRTNAGVLDATEYLFVSSRNTGLGLEQMQADAEMILAEGTEVPGERGPSVHLTWTEGPDVDVVLWWLPGDSYPWLRIDGEPTLHRVERGLFMRLRAMLDAAQNAG